MIQIKAIFIWLEYKKSAKKKKKGPVCFTIPLNLFLCIISASITHLKPFKHGVSSYCFLHWHLTEQTACTSGVALLWKIAGLSYTWKNALHRPCHFIYSFSTWHTVHTNLKRPPETGLSPVITTQIVQLIKTETLIINKEGGALVIILH